MPWFCLSADTLKIPLPSLLSKIIWLRRCAETLAPWLLLLLSDSFHMFLSLDFIDKQKNILMKKDVLLEYLFLVGFLFCYRLV